LKIQTVNARAMPTLLLCKEILIEQRAQLAAKMEEMQRTLDFLDYKIEVYEKAVQRTLDFLDYKIEVYEKAVLETEKEIIQIDD